ncbi:hypothetical protein MJO29_006017 [Puccinia striiformis f. sp. tritici]|nr:hypothetical protein MJO29_006017 [Puccinia striiformis f. sp. tritici]
MALNRNHQARQELNHLAGMRQYSKWQSVIRELFTLLLLQHNDNTDDLINKVFRLPGSPTIGDLLFSDNPNMMLVINKLFNDKGNIGELLQTVTSSRCLHTRAALVFRDKFDLAKLFEMCSIDFKQATRTTKEVFIWLLNRIYLHDVFHNNSFRPQLPVPHQLALALERLGSNGNGASVGQCARNLNIARGTVIKRMALCDSPGDFFDPACSLTMTTIPPYKVPAANIPKNIEFNYCLAKSRVRNKHTNGSLVIPERDVITSVQARAYAGVYLMDIHLYYPTQYAHIFG